MLFQSLKGLARGNPQNCTSVTWALWYFRSSPQNTCVCWMPLAARLGSAKAIFPNNLEQSIQILVDGDPTFGHVRSLYRYGV